MAVKNSKTAADGATEGAVTDSTTNQAGADTAAVTSQPDISAGDTTAAAAEIVPAPAPAAAAPDPQAAELIAGERVQVPVMLHPESLAQLADLLTARLAPVPAENPTPAKVEQPTAPRVTCRALRPINHDGVTYGPLAPSGDEFSASASEAASLFEIGAVELL